MDCNRNRIPFENRMQALHKSKNSGCPGSLMEALSFITGCRTQWPDFLEIKKGFFPEFSLDVNHYLFSRDEGKKRHTHKLELRAFKIVMVCFSNGLLKSRFFL